MRIRTTVSALAVGLAVLGLAACSSSTTSTSSTKAEAPASSTAAAQPTSAEPPAPEAPAAGTASAAPTASIPPKPDEATTAAYIAALKAIDPEIVGDKPDRAVSRGRDQCRSVADSPKDTAGLVDLANKRFTSPKHPDGFGAEKSAKILQVVRKHICPTYGT
ncbi:MULTISPECIES: hypothetical protein [Streptomycetaceae]|uniref:hypothetical protein n=1 Tax=Streptomycetaceae TaxID=2062 RepID=UPI00093CE1CE|nr:hypothetical protein [Streptomyces sp. CB02056]